MKQCLSIVRLAFLTTCLTSVVATSCASAAKPEFVYAGTKTGFSSKSGPMSFFAKSGLEMKCLKDTDTGEISGPSGTDKAANIVITFKECTVKILGKIFACKSTLAGNEEVRTNALEGELGYINKNNKEVGLALFPQAPAVTITPKITCTSGANQVTIEVKGEVVGKITPINTKVGPGQPVEKFTLDFKVRVVKSEQQYQELEVLGALLKGILLSSNLNGGAFEFAGVETTDEVFPSEIVEVSA